MHSGCGARLARPHLPAGGWLRWTLAASVVLAGCSAGVRTLDSREIEGQIATGINEQTGIPAIVECPENIPLQAGNRFMCTARAGKGSRADVAVTQTDGRGHVAWRLMN